MFNRRSLGIVTLWLLFLPFSPWPSFADDPGMFMAGTDMKLGMAEEPLVAKLQNGYKLTKVNDHSWAIWEKEGPPYKFVGSIAFTGGRLSWISKDWGSFHGDEAMAFAKEFFSLLTSVAANQPSPVIVHPRVTVRQPGLVISDIDLLYSDRKISVSIVESKDKGNSVSISEVIKRE